MSKTPPIVYHPGTGAIWKVSKKKQNDKAEGKK
jgi:hypothetical protein